MTKVQEAAIKLAASGLKRGEIAEALVDYLVSKNIKPASKRMRKARAKIAQWEQTQWYRDKVWELSVNKLDVDSPNILAGIARKARRGETHAARLALEVTGRHNPKGDNAPAVVNISFGGLPRPSTSPSTDADGSGPEEIEDADWEPSTDG